MVDAVASEMGVTNQYSVLEGEKESLLHRKSKKWFPYKNNYEGFLYKTLLDATLMCPCYVQSRESA